MSEVLERTYLFTYRVEITDDFDEDDEREDKAVRRAAEKLAASLGTRVERIYSADEIHEELF